MTRQRSDRLRRTRSERQADPGRSAARRAGGGRTRRAELLSFPDYDTPIGAEIARALHGERDYAPDVMQLLYVANRYEKRARIEAWLAAGGHRLRPLHGVEHRLRRGAGTRSRRGSPRSSSSCRRRSDASCSTSRRRPRPSARPRAATATSATSTLLSARARQLPAPGPGAARWAAASTASARRTRSPADVRRGSRDTTRAAVSARTSRAPASFSTRAHASSVAPVVRTSSTSTTAEVR